MEKQKMIALRRTLGTINTTDRDTIAMAGCLQLLDQEIADVVRREQLEAENAKKLDMEKAKPKKMKDEEAADK